MKGIKDYSIRQIRQSASRQRHCNNMQQQPRSRTILSLFAFHLSKSVIAIYGSRRANRFLCILMCQLSTFFEIVGFVLLYKSSSLISGYSGHFRLYGRTVACRLAEVLKSIGAYIRTLGCICHQTYNVLHKRYNDLVLCATSTDSASRNLHYRQGQTCLVLRESFSWV